MPMTGMALMDVVEEGLADIWLQMDAEGGCGLQEEIEEVARLFPAPVESAAGRHALRRAHDLFLRAHAVCPHCRAMAA